MIISIPVGIIVDVASIIVDSVEVDFTKADSHASAMPSDHFLLYSV